MEQHFLTNPDKLRKLVAAAGIKSGDRVLELGSGGGTVAATLPPCTLTLVELNERLAERLHVRFPSATVISGDALTALEKLEADVTLSNLPHSMTPAVLAKLNRKTFRCAVVAVHGNDNIDAFRSRFSALRLEPLFTLDRQDFTPPQPFSSQLLWVTRRYSRQQNYDEMQQT